LPTNQLRASVCGNSSGSRSWNSRSWATITVHGARIVLSRLPGDSAGRSICLAAAERTNTKRAGEALALVGPNFMRS